MDVSLFDLIHPANSNSWLIIAKIRVFSRDFSAFCRIFLTHLLHRVPQAKQLKELLTKEIRL